MTINSPLFTFVRDSFIFTFVTRRPSETGHVAVARVTIPLLHARAVIRAKIVRALFARMQIGVHVAAGFHQGAGNHRVGNQVSALAAEVQRRETPLETVSAQYLLW